MARHLRLAFLLLAAALFMRPLHSQATAPDQFSLTAGEIGVEGRIQSLDRTKKTAVLRVTAVLQPDGTPVALPRPVIRTVRVTPQTYVRARTDASRQLSFGHLKTGMLIDAAGTDLGAGRGLQARDIAAEGVGKAGKRSPAGGPAVKTPSRTLLVVARGAAFLPDGQTLAVIDGGGRLQLWSTVSLKQVQAAPGPADGAHFVAVSLDGRMVVRDGRTSPGGSGDLVRTYRVDHGKLTEAGLLRGHEGSVLSAVFFHGSQMLATGGADQSVRIWTVGSAEAPRVLAAGGPVSQLAVSPDEKLLAAGTPAQVIVWNLATGEKAFAAPGSGPGVDFSPDSRSMVTAASDGTLEIWSTATWQRTRTVKPGPGRAYRVRYSPDGRLIASSPERSRSILLTGLSTGKTSDVLLGGSPWLFSRDGRYLLTSVGDALRLWSVPRK